ncbi:Major facilitator superfamily [Syntrophomonas zehnderi OL-4]|uniref:Major facilitator superfamily n=1 Tax=Syntrophomonas zehnderi OL-4 TaxID=690567 RepID=A0A0E4C9D5_9FIRM|nr:MFS transporter [Syntrophomonas zehnderi]CFX94029.1 Major facilitator superfamily [Syntrophomonas zehnderi OL-4]
MIKKIASRNKFRYVLIVSMSLMWIVVYLQRVNIGALLVDARFLQELGLVGQTAQQGLLMTVFLLVYSLANIAAVPISNRLGSRKAILLGIFIASGAMLAGGWMGSLAAILMVRVLLGIGNGIHFPNMSILVKRWFPPHERGTANSMYGVGGCVGMIVAFPLFSTINSRLGWEFSFFIPALLALLCTFPLWMRWISDRPQDNPYISKEEINYITASYQNHQTHVPETAPKIAGDKSLLLNPSFILLCIAYTAFLCSWWGILTWMPQYLVQARQFDINGTSNNLALAYLVAAVGILTGGRWVDRAERKSSIAILALVCVAVATLGIALVSSPVLAIVFMVMAVGINEFVYPAVWSMLQMLMPDSLMAAGAGIMSGVSNLMSAVSPFAIGWLIQMSGSYVGGLLFLVTISGLGAVSCVLLYQQGY